MVITSCYIIMEITLEIITYCSINYIIMEIMLVCKYNVNCNRNYVIMYISFEITWNTFQLCQKQDGFHVSKGMKNRVCTCISTYMHV